MKRLNVVAAAAVVLVVVLMHPGGGSTLDISPLVSCEPDCTGVADGGKAPDPFDCTSFYFCMSGLPVSHPTSCGAGNQFNEDDGACEVGSGCKSACTQGYPVCSLSCDDALSFIGDATDCSAYYICTPSGTDGPRYCPADRPNFNGVDCVNDGSVCCKGYCDPVCDDTKDFSFSPDPKDCTRYYICDENIGVSSPDESLHFSCPSGNIFDVAKLKCVAGDANSCVTLCDAFQGNGGDGGGGGGGGGSSGCVSSLTCPGVGNYAACDTCTTQYFDCGYTGAAGVASTCPSGTLFNPNPRYPVCVREANCPYYP